MDEGFAKKVIFDCLLETAALRHDASLYYRLHTVVPHLARSALNKKAEARYSARFFDSIEVFEDPVAYQRLRNGHVHADEDEPAVFFANGQKEWWTCGEVHRVGKPAVVDGMGKEWWYVEGKLHRDEGPAVIDGKQMEWWIDGRRHRDGQPAVISETKIAWYHNGTLHCTNGPAWKLYNGGTVVRREWYVHGRRHRSHGPAVIDDNHGTYYVEYWDHGARIFR